VVRTVLWPKLPVASKRRPLLERWLHDNADKRIRFLVAPAGWGKTGTLLRYAANVKGEAAYCKVPENCRPDEFFDRVSLAVNIPFCETGAQVAGALSGLENRIEIILDDLDRADPAAIAAFLDLARGVAPHVKFIAGVRNADAFAGCGNDCVFS